MSKPYIKEYFEEIKQGEIRMIEEKACKEVKQSEFNQIEDNNNKILNEVREFDRRLREIEITLIGHRPDASSKDDVCDKKEPSTHVERTLDNQDTSMRYLRSMGFTIDHLEQTMPTK